MSALQLALALAGAVVLLGILLYNGWSARRNAPRRAESTHDSEPTLGPDLVVVESEPGGQGPENPPAPTSNMDALPVLGGRPHLDPLIDAITAIALDAGPVSGEALLAALPATRRVGSKPLAVEARRQDNGTWEFPLAGAGYTALQAGVQLANRTGALTEIEFSEYVAVVQRYADAVGGAPDFPDMLSEVARARELDQIAGVHDAQLSFTIRARGATWGLGFVAQQAGRAGFIAGATPGRMVLPSVRDGQPPILVLGFDTQTAVADASMAAVAEVSLGFDVPCVARTEQPFLRLCQAAEFLAQAMDGLVADDAGRPLDPSMINAIADNLGQLYDALERHGLSAGSPEARRLFS